MLQLWFFANTLLWQINIELFGLKLGLNVLLLAIFGTVWILRRQVIASYSAKMLFAFATILVFTSLLGVITGPCTDKFQKLLITAPVFLFLTLIGLEVGWRATDRDWIKLQKVAGWVLLGAFAGFSIEMLFPMAFPTTERYRNEAQFSGIYSEPSFVAFSLFPCLLILLDAQCKQVRRKGLFALFGLVLLSRSTTLIALILVFILYHFIKKPNLGHAIYMIVGISLIAGMAAIFNYELLVAPTLDRIVGVAVVDSVDNLSSVVYLQGWQDAEENLLRTNGLGLGFNMMGCNPLPDVPARSVVGNLSDAQHNNEDGSILFGKLISETGVFGLIIFLALVWWWIKKELDLLRFSSDLQGPARSIPLVLILSFVATSLIRSSGYFSGSFFILVVAVAATAKWQKDRIARIPARQIIKK